MSSHRPTQQPNPLVDPPDFVSKFLAHDREDRDEIITSVQAYFLAHWDWPSPTRKAWYSKADLEDWTTLMCPAGPSERAWAFTAYVTFWFLYDDLMEIMGPEELGSSIPRIARILHGEEGLEDMTTPEFILKEICLKINTIAPGKRIFEATLVYMKAATAKQERLQSLTLGFDAYLKYRMLDAACWLTLEGAYWVQEITIPEHLKTEKIWLLQELSLFHGILINDLFSYRKEVKASSQEVQDHDKTLYNGLVILMQSYQFTLLEALEEMKKKIWDYEDEFMAVLDDVRETHKSSAEDREFIERLAVALMDVIGGNVAWSACCGRYNRL
uniref:Putative sesquiterpene synthase n=1 Tax=Clitopilus sp. TaxID=1967123 RepID=A0A4P2VFN8_9AGAR|nr:putative sesquiterpene synthase [Clitopilus sp.]